MARFNLSFAGAGRVAGALCRGLYHSGIKILQIVSESESDGKPLADTYNASWSPDLNFLDTNDIIIVAVPDHNLKEVLSQIKCSERTHLVHTAGSFGLEAFPADKKKCGVFYPLQTFSEGRNIELKGLPFLLEAAENDTGVVLTNLVQSLGGEVHLIDTEHRKMLHLSAVFVNNFTNYMLTAGKEIASKAGLSFNILVPLIKETISKALEEGPEKSQTGPAVRNDLNTIEKHIDLLSFSPELQGIYRDVTQSIIKYYSRADNDKF